MENIFEKFDKDYIFTLRKKIGLINPNQYPTLDLMQIIVLSEILDTLKSENKGINIKLEELNKTQLLNHLERDGIEISDLEKLSKEEILKKIGE